MAAQAPEGKKRILVVEDEADVRELIVLHLKRDGYAVDAAADGAEALRWLEKSGCDLCIVDWMMPGLNGLDVARAIRNQLRSPIPVLMVTARVEAADIVLGLESGADDYVTKPFEVPVLLARVRALLRRSAAAKSGEDQNLIEVGAIRIDVAAHEVSHQGEVISLTPSEFNILLALAQNRGRVLTRDRLIDLIRGVDVTIVSRAIDTHVFGLRKKLGDAADVIETIRGVGYRIKA